MTSVVDTQGSLWRRWDPHLHAPGTALADQFGSATVDDFVDAVEKATPTISALGVTDYLSSNCYESVLAKKQGGRLEGVSLLFPNIEMRLSIGTKKGAGINLHLLVSPDDPDHVTEIARFLKRLYFEYKSDKYYCSSDDLIRLGRAHDSSVSDDTAAYRSGVNQFKVDFKQLREELDRPAWMRRNCLVAVVAGSNDGTAGLQEESASFDAQRREIESFADVILSGNPADAAFWRGESSLSVSDLTKKYGGTKPCVHGSDAHDLESVGSPNLDRFTWIKGDPVFDSLRQACIEPEARVFIGDLPPELRSPERSIARLATTGAPWLLDDGIQLNPGLIAIIGARGSGKTALADLLARAGSSRLPLAGVDSFITRATGFFGGVGLTVDWSTGESTSCVVQDDPDVETPDVHYLSQQFVERLCDPEGSTDELISEIQKVVFAAHDPAKRLGATDFDELAREKIGDTQLRRQYLREQMDRISEQVLQERQTARALPGQRTKKAELETTLKKALEARTGIVRPGEEDRASYYARLRAAIDQRNRALQALEKASQAVEHLRAEASRHERQVFPEMLKELKRSYAGAQLGDAEWEAFAIRFAGEPDEILTLRKAAITERIATTRAGSDEGDPTIEMNAAQLSALSIDKLKKSFKAVAEQMGVDKTNAQKLKNLDAQIAQHELELEKLTAAIQVGEGSPDRQKELAETRAQYYTEFFSLIVEEQAVLHELYEPLQTRLASATDTLQRLRLVVLRTVDVDAWAQRGEDLLDLRKAGKFQGRGSLAKVARTYLVPAWESGGADEVSQAMERFRGDFNQALLDQAKVERGTTEYQQWTLDVGRWLYSTDHVDVTYGFEYDGMSLGQLSPGNRGIVLLLLYLALDLDDHRPLIIDQPEENLDPRSVFTELVQLFRAARSRRQVIVITHNANLVVNTDVDQVIVANCKRGSGGKPPKFTYQSGGLENQAIREEVCEILEGGEAAFRERAKRLRVSDY